MPSRFTHEQLVDKALLVLREALHQRYETRQPLPASGGLRLELAVLYTGGDRTTFDDFWKQATEPCDYEVDAIAFGRFQAMRTCMAAISRANGVDSY